MDLQFCEWLYQYPSVDSLQKLEILKNKYLTKNDKIKYIHITGTNGKGSVARYLHQLLSQGLNLKVGLFTSPHITIVNERIMINNQMISDQELLNIKNLIAADVNTYQLGFFAILTLIALIYFQAQKVDWAIIEVGIGGRLDATNIIKSDYCIITSLAKDHTEMLGNTLAEILKQKLGIVKDTTKKFFVSGNINSQYKEQIKKMINNTDIIFSAERKNSSYFIQNQALVKTVITNITPDMKEDHINKIIRQTNINLRFEKFNINNKAIYFDVAHNLAGIKALIKIIKAKKIKIDKVIFSALSTKNPERLIQQLKKITTNIIICHNQHPKSINGLDFNFKKMISNDVNDTFLITGSCYFAADVYNEMRKEESSNS